MAQPAARLLLVLDPMQFGYLGSLLDFTGILVLVHEQKMEMAVETGVQAAAADGGRGGGCGTSAVRNTSVQQPGRSHHNCYATFADCRESGRALS